MFDVKIETLDNGDRQLTINDKKWVSTKTTTGYKFKPVGHNLDCETHPIALLARKFWDCLMAMDEVELFCIERDMAPDDEFASDDDYAALNNVT
jgi:hypothetical protein